MIRDSHLVPQLHTVIGPTNLLHHLLQGAEPAVDGVNVDSNVLAQVVQLRGAEVGEPHGGGRRRGAVVAARPADGLPLPHFGTADIYFSYQVLQNWYLALRYFNNFHSFIT
jgi:hypothetical protein